MTERAFVRRLLAGPKDIFLSDSEMVRLHPICDEIFTAQKAGQATRYENGDKLLEIFNFNVKARDLLREGRDGNFSMLSYKAAKVSLDKLLTMVDELSARLKQHSFNTHSIVVELIRRIKVEQSSFHWPFLVDVETTDYPGVWVLVADPFVDSPETTKTSLMSGGKDFALNKHSIPIITERIAVIRRWLIKKIRDVVEGDRTSIITYSSAVESQNDAETLTQSGGDTNMLAIQRLLEIVEQSTVSFGANPKKSERPATKTNAFEITEPLLAAFRLQIAKFNGNQWEKMDRRIKAKAKSGKGRSYHSFYIEGVGGIYYSDGGPIVFRDTAKGCQSLSATHSAKIGKIIAKDFDLKR